MFIHEIFDYVVVSYTPEIIQRMRNHWISKESSKQDYP